MPKITLTKMFRNENDAPTQAPGKPANWRQIQVEGPATGDAAVVFIAGNLTAAKRAQIEALGLVVRVIAAETGIAIPTGKTLVLTIRTAVCRVDTPPPDEVP